MACKGCAALREERDYLRGELSKLTGSLVRIERAREGLSEVPRDIIPPPPPMPMTLRQIIQGLDSPRLRTEWYTTAEKLYAECRDWDAVELQIIDGLGVANG